MTKQEKIKKELKLENRVLTLYKDGKSYEYIDYNLQLLIQIIKDRDGETISIYNVDVDVDVDSLNFIKMDKCPIWHVQNALNQYYELTRKVNQLQ